jgi:hypothetical protein
MVSKALGWLCEEPEHSFTLNKIFRRGWPGLANFFLLPKQLELGRAARPPLDHAVTCRPGPTMTTPEFPAAWKTRGRLLLTVSKPYQNAILSSDGTCL